MPASADVIYSNLQDIAIPATFDGLYLNVETGAWNTNMASPEAGWDINPFYGGRSVANSPDFQPVRSGTGSDSPILNLSTGTTVSSGSVFSTFTWDHDNNINTPAVPGYGGSQTLTGMGGNFTAGQEGYLGFKLNGSDYGWMRVVFTNNSGGALIKDWAYDNSGGAIATGNVLQNGSTYTLDSSTQSFALGSTITGSNSVVVQGGNTVTLAGTNTYDGGTTLSAGTLALGNSNAAGTGLITLAGSSAAHLQINADITIANDITFSNTNAASSVIRTVAVSGDYTIGTDGVLKSSFSGGAPDTTVEILDGTNSDTENTSVLTMSMSASSSATNDSARRSDVFNISGTGSDAYVIQILVDGGLASDSFLAFWDVGGTNTWVAAGETFIAEAYNSLTHTVGDYGFDSVTNSVWAVVDYGGSFTAIPEPTSALAGLLLTAGLLRRRR
jgi:autotransporter-associated beta strand protein